MVIRMAMGGGLIMAMLVLAMVQPVTLVQVETGDGILVLCSRILPGTPITLSFTHSMFGGSVRETYLVDDSGQLVRQSIVTENAASAEYYATDGRVRREADGYEVLAGPFTTDELVVRVDGIGDHELVVGGRSWQLSDMFREPVQVRLSGEQMPRIRVPDACLSP